MNAKEEFEDFVTSRPNVICAIITVMDDDLKAKQTVLRIGYTEEQYQDFLNSLDFDYDDGYGLQYLYGTIWFNNNTWATRGEYDGSEWWIYNECPQVVTDCYPS
jgi:hypothetical protein